MFIQVMEGELGDLDLLKRQMETWETELRPGAIGFLGSTGGLTADGRFILFARFESAAAARQNSERPEQDEWWAETQKGFDGEVSFVESEDVTTFLGAGSNDAGFVQIMKNSAANRERLEFMDGLFDQYGPTFRPDIIGGVRVWTGPTSFVEAAYFTSEAEARAGESAEPPPGLAEHMPEFGELMADTEFADISDPLIN